MSSKGLDKNGGFPFFWKRSMHCSLPSQKVRHSLPKELAKVKKSRHRSLVLWKQKILREILTHTRPA